MTKANRSYADPCGVARALDVVGERWALLVVRELSLGPRRFGQLRTGLPDVSPNVLSQRLRELEVAGITRRYDLEPPANTTVYELTDRGYALDPVLQALGRWGAIEPAITSREMSAVSFLRMLRVVVAPGARDVRFGLLIGEEAFGVTLADGSVDVVRGASTEAAVTLAGDVTALRTALLSNVDLRDLEADGSLVIVGDRRVARRVARSFRMPA